MTIQGTIPNLDSLLSLTFFRDHTRKGVRGVGLERVLFSDSLKKVNWVRKEIGEDENKKETF